MARRYWSGDFHLGHGNLIDYCKRPYKNSQHQTERIVGSCNMRIHDDDTVVHVGDFINYGNAKGVPGERIKPLVYLKMLKGNWVMVEGNHDGNNRLKTVARYLFSRVAHFNVFVTHYPTSSNRIPETLKKALPSLVDFVVCAHVHDKWREWFDPELKLWNINVGIDVWKYMPISDDELAGHYVSLIKSKRRKHEKKIEEEETKLPNVQAAQDEKGKSVE